MFRGNAPARIDEKGRLKVPNAFRTAIETKYGRALFITSLTGEYMRIYPMPVWLEIEEKLGATPSTNPARLRFLDRVNYFGQDAEFDTQGRVLVPFRLRESASMTGDVDVLGQLQLPRRVEPRAFPHQDAARAVHGRRRAHAVGVRDLTAHIPVLAAEAVQYLQPERGGVFVDCTIGLGGHASALLWRPAPPASSDSTAISTP